MEFCTVINCMDGRVQLPVIQFLQKRFNARYVDTITEPGPNRILAEENDTASIFRRVDISVHHHHSQAIAVVGHFDCAGNPAQEAEQHRHLQKAVQRIKKRYPEVEVIGLWVDAGWEVREVTNKDGG